jgi:hypothetical protein
MYISSTQQPYHGAFARMTGRLIGIYAEGAEHRLTHHGTRTHTHALLKDAGGQLFTAHVERIGVRAGSTIRLPAR